jgi:2-polyprenyl-6-methoxyphenol hydroxylase-like FAD-dependent oxidoreductase
MKPTISTDVIIAGAGPTGLALACQLIRYGVDFVIFDKREGLTPYSKAIGVQARTLEIYEQIGLAKSLIEQGAPMERVRMMEGGEVRAVVELSSLGRGVSPYPYMLIVEQSKHERVLYDFIEAHGEDVLWQTTMDSFSQNEDGVTANITDPTGEAQTIHGKYLIACDGAKSSVRTELGMTFGGSTFERMFYVADVQIAWKLPHDALVACLAKDRSTAFFPMPGEDRYRIVGAFPEGFDKDTSEILYEEIERQVVEDTRLDLDVYKVNWFSSYKVHSRRVDSFSKGRCFLAGDAAHIHSPAGGQGMNTGIQDGYNLAWKLAVVLQGRAHPRILDSYNEERVENAKRLVETTDRMFDLLASPDWLTSFLRLHVFPRVANLVLRSQAINHFIFPLISQTGINYRDRSLSVPNGKKFEVKGGDRMPYLVIDGESIYDKLREPRFHLITFSNERENDQTMKEQIESKYNDLVDYHSFPLDSRVAEAFGTHDAFNVLLRPDNYVAFVSHETPLSELSSYIHGVIGGLQSQAGHHK